MTVAHGFRWPRRLALNAIARASARTKPREPSGKRSRELLAFIRQEVGRTGAFPTDEEMKAAMRWQSQRSVEDVLLRLVEHGLVERHAIARKGTRRLFSYRLVSNVATQTHEASP